MKNRLSFPALVFALAGLGGCHSSTDPKDTGSTTPPVIGAKTGILVDSPVQGVAYSTTSGVKGTTDVAGTYKFNASDNVEFKIGAVSLGSIGALGIITPIELAQGSATKLQNLLVLLQSLDSDGNSANGITIPSAAAAALPASVDLSQPPATFASPANTGLQAALTAGGITTPIVSTTNANAAFLAQGMALLSSNIWAWSTTTDGGALRVSPSGAYIMGQAKAAGGGGMAGMELGTVSLAGFDSYGYWHAPATTTIDTNGQWGLSTPRSTDRFRFNGDQLLSGDYTEGPLSPINKMENDPTGLVGAWAYDSATTINTHLFLFFSNGHYLIVDPRGGGSGAMAGVEYGSYTYNTTTKVLTASNIQYDTNGSAGLHDTVTGTYGTPSWTLSPDGMTMAVVGGAGPLTFYRVSK